MAMCRAALPSPPYCQLVTWMIYPGLKVKAAGQRQTQNWLMFRSRTESGGDSVAPQDSPIKVQSHYEVEIASQYEK
jgi:hypothetical protein